MKICSDRPSTRGAESLVLEPARPEDAAALTQCARRAKAFWGYSQATLDAWEQDLTVEPDAVARGHYVVALDRGRLAGFGAIGKEAPGLALIHLWVEPEQMRRGVGRALFLDLAQRARSLGVPVLSIDADPYAAPFYEALGAVRTGSCPAPIAEDPLRVRPQFIYHL